jgi:hypothetical protein
LNLSGGLVAVDVGAKDEMHALIRSTASSSSTRVA